MASQKTGTAMIEIERLDHRVRELEKLAHLPTDPSIAASEDADAGLLVQRLDELAAVQMSIAGRLDNLHQILQAMIAAGRA